MRQFRDWQFTKGAVEPPQEYLDYILCAHIYHCAPDMLDSLPAWLTELHLEFWADEQARKSGKKRQRHGRTLERGKHTRNYHQGNRQRFKGR